jgi:hypothetical protein
VGQAPREAEGCAMIWLAIGVVAVLFVIPMEPWNWKKGL